MKRVKDGNDHTLESSRLFPYAAWILIGLFCIFVYGITTNLRTAAAELQINTNISETSLKAPVVKKPHHDSGAVFYSNHSDGSSHMFKPSDSANACSHLAPLDVSHIGIIKTVFMSPVAIIGLW